MYEPGWFGDLWERAEVQSVIPAIIDISEDNPEIETADSSAQRESDRVISESEAAESQTLLSGTKAQILSLMSDK